MAVVSGASFVVALIGLVLVPRQASRTAHSLSAALPPLADTTPVIRERRAALRTIAQSDSALLRARARLRAAVPPPPPVPPDTLAPAQRAERDSLRGLLEQLTAAAARAAVSPLPPAFRALAHTPALQGDARVRVWLDSLNQVDNLRAPFGALGAGDPIYVALTARVNELGRAIRDAAARRQGELRARLVPLLAPPPAAAPAVTLPSIDTMPLVRRRADAVATLARANVTLDSLRRYDARIDAEASRARELANVGAPPLAMLGAALVIALAVGFGVSFVAEVRHPRVAHLREGEVVSGTRVLAVVRPTVVVERDRRQSDLEGPPLIDIVSESYRTLYLHLAATEASLPVVTVTGDLPTIVATVAANLAAVAAYEARSTLLVDADPAAGAVAAVLRVRPLPGLTGILAGRADWAGAVVSTTIGRDRPLDVLPSGEGRLTQSSADAVTRVRETLARLERRYDFVVIVASTSYAQLVSGTVIPAPDVVVCAHIGRTRLADLRAAVKSLRGAGRVVHGVVLWDDEMPRLR